MTIHDPFPDPGTPLPPALLRTADAAEFLGISETSLRRLRAFGLVRPVWVGRCLRYRFTDLQRFVEALEQEPKPAGRCG